MYNLIVAKNLSKIFGKIYALRKVSFSVSGGIIGLLGPNGSGKTTFINMLVGLVRPSDGNLYCMGFDSWYESKEVRRRVGILLEDERYPEYIDGYTFLKIQAKLIGNRDALNYVKEVSKKIGMYTNLSKRIKEYSAGMKKKLGILSALLNIEAELIILDEPFADLDYVSRYELVSLIKSLSEERRVSFLISTHLISDLEDIVSKVIMIKDGTLRYVGDVKRFDEREKGRQISIKVDNNIEALKVLKSMDADIEPEISGEHIIVKIYGDIEIWRILKTLEDNGMKVLDFSSVKSELGHLYRKYIGE